MSLNSDYIIDFERLVKILTMEVTYPPILLTLTFFIIQSDLNEIPTVLLVVIILVKLAIPFILFVLIKWKKFFWLTFLLIFIVLPSGVIYWLIIESIFSKFFLLIPLSLFYFYCLLLKWAANDWLAEAEAKLERENNTNVKS